MHTWYLSFFLHWQNFWRIKYTPKKRVNYEKIQKKLPIFLRYYGKIHSKLPIFRVKSVKIYTGQKKFTREFSWLSWQISGMPIVYYVCCHHFTFMFFMPPVHYLCCQQFPILSRTQPSLLQICYKKFPSVPSCKCVFLSRTHNAPSLLFHVATNNTATVATIIALVWKMCIHRRCVHPILQIPGLRRHKSIFRCI